MRLIPLLTALLIAAGLYYWFELRHDPVVEPAGVALAVRAEAPGDHAAAADMREAPVPVVVLPSEARETSAELVLRGRTWPDRSVQVAAETTGRVVSPPLRRGATVAEGQVLCQLDPGTRAAEQAEAEASLEEAQVQAAGASTLAKKGYAADTELKQRKAQLRAAQAGLDKVRADIARLEIRAPFAGVLETDTAELGTLLAPGALCAEVVDLDPIMVRSYVSEQDVDQLRTGQTAAVRMVNDATAEGEVTFISRSGDEQTRTFDVEVTIPNPDREIRAGVTAEVLVALPPRLAHLVPQTALTLDDDGRLGVRTAEDGVARFHAVTILRETPDGVWLDGLPPRAEVIVIGQEFVREGRQVAATPVAESAIAGQGSEQAPVERVAVPAAVEQAPVEPTAAQSPVDPLDGPAADRTPVDVLLDAPVVAPARDLTEMPVPVVRPDQAHDQMRDRVPGPGEAGADARARTGSQTQ